MPVILIPERGSKKPNQRHRFESRLRAGAVALSVLLLAIAAWLAIHGSGWWK